MSVASFPIVSRRTASAVIVIRNYASYPLLAEWMTEDIFHQRVDVLRLLVKTGFPNNHYDYFLFLFCFLIIIVAAIWALGMRSQVNSYPLLLLFVPVLILTGIAFRRRRIQIRYLEFLEKLKALLIDFNKTDHRRHSLRWIVRNTRSLEDYAEEYPNARPVLIIEIRHNIPQDNVDEEQLPVYYAQDPNGITLPKYAEVIEMESSPGGSSSQSQTQIQNTTSREIIPTLSFLYTAIRNYFLYLSSLRFIYLPRPLKVFLQSLSSTIEASSDCPPIERSDQKQASKFGNLVTPSDVIGRLSLACFLGFVAFYCSSLTVMSWSGFKKNLNRAGTTLMQKAGAVDKTVDRDFDDEVQKFKTQVSRDVVLLLSNFFGTLRLEAKAEALTREAKGFLDALRAMSTSQKRIAETIANFRDESHSEMNAIGQQYKTVVEQLDEQSRGELDSAFRTTVLEPLSRFCAYFPDINAAISRRNKKLLDYDAIRSKVRKLVDKPSEDTSKLPLAEREANQAHEIYERYNTLLINEIPIIVDMRIPYVDPSFEALVKSQYQFVRESNDAFESLRSGFPATENTADGRVEGVLQQMRELSICGM
ncbi:hypothetical protein BZG36_00545 [Bifiguratus adelaidae]|uniref:BAR domain-containing protein n=1 Tax=Bifiguratus adelaidae TaxID=1938954 RepID=A0A261Y743_9FUNG|nr:hypothetical protein BZG36_00545 [Bifiguratus adelaidae]